MSCRSTLWRVVTDLTGKKVAPFVTALTLEETVALGDWLSRISPPYDNEPVRSAIHKLSAAADLLRGHI